MLCFEVSSCSLIDVGLFCVHETVTFRDNRHVGVTRGVAWKALSLLDNDLSTRAKFGILPARHHARGV